MTVSIHSRLKAAEEIFEVVFSDGAFQYTAA